VRHLFTEGGAMPTVLLRVPFFMAFMVLVTENPVAAPISVISAVSDFPSIITR
jgi:hypothetical protein